MSVQRSTHFDDLGHAHMVDVSDKRPTVRTAVARGGIKLSREAAESIRQGDNAKGDVIAVARLAAIGGSKWTSHLIPLCHAIAIESVQVDFSFVETEISLPPADRETLICRATVKTSGKTGVEMEALTAVMTGLLTVYDMIKAIDKAAEIGSVTLVEKTGGKSGHYVR